MTGRPSSYNQKTADAIAEKLSEGIPLKRICAEPDMPGYTTVLRWQEAYPEFRDLSARAKADGTHNLADECLTIADTATPEEVPVARLRIDTRLRLIGKWNSRAYGDKLDVAHSGELQINVVDSFNTE